MKAVLERNLGFLGFPDYSVDTEGRVFSYPKLTRSGVREMVSSYNKNGYKFVHFRKNGHLKNFMVHRLVALAFIPNPENKPCIDHINTKRDDNRVENLRWVTYKENSNNVLSLMKHIGENNAMFNKKRPQSMKDYLSKIWSKPVIQYTLNGEYVATYPSAKKASELTHIHKDSIRKCCNGQYTQAGGFNWEYTTNPHTAHIV